MIVHIIEIKNTKTQPAIRIGLEKKAPMHIAAPIP